MDIEVIKSSGAVCRVGLARVRDGLQVTTWISPSLEELVRSWGTGEPQDVAAYGRHWTPVKEEKLLVWPMQQDPGVLLTPEGQHFSLSRPGRPTLVENNILNFGAVRLVGASEGIGKTFIVKGVFSPEYIRDLANQFGAAGKALYLNFLRPVNITMTVSLQEMR